MKIAVIGAGGVGGYYGAKLAHAGYNVTLVARGEHLNAIERNGLKVKSILGDFHAKDVSVTNSISKLNAPDLVILGVKAWQVPDVAKELATVITPNTVVLPLQNGVMAAEELSQHLNPSNVLGGLCRIISKIDSPGVINHFGIKPAIVFGEINGSITPRVALIKEVFDKAEIDSKASTDITADLWMKFISICVSGLLAVSKTNYGELTTTPETRELMIDLLTEVYTLSQRIGVKIPESFLGKTIAFIDSYPPESTSSLTRDVWEGKPSEIDYQNGTVVKLGLKHNVPTPVNQFVYSCILPMEKKARKGM